MSRVLSDFVSRCRSTMQTIAKRVCVASNFDPERSVIDALVVEYACN